MTAIQLYNVGELDGAVAAAIAEVKAQPANVQARWTLAQMLIASGALDRADNHLDVISSQDPKTVARMSLTRQLIRAETARRQLWSDGRPPEFLLEVPQSIQHLLHAAVLLREGAAAEAANFYRLAEEARRSTPGLDGDATFSDFRDLDDRFAGVCEVLTSTGKYYWIPTEQIVSFQARKPEDILDTLWRPVELTVLNGPTGVVYFPVVYPATTEVPAALQLGRETRWIESSRPPACGMGARLYLVGELDKSLDELGEITFDAPPKTEAAK